MTNRWIASWLPEEWQSAWSALRALASVDQYSTASRARTIAGFMFPFALGAVCAYYLAEPLQSTGARDALYAILAGLMAVGALVAGFMLSMMLSSGRIERAESLTYEVVRDYAARLKVLMLSQAITLLASIMTTLIALVWLVALGLDARGSVQTLWAVLLGGFTAVSVLRCVLIPLQIFEIHEAALDDTVKHRLDETRTKFKR